MKKVLSFVLVLSMVLGSVSMAFATTTNTVAKQPTVAADSNMPIVEIILEAEEVIPVNEAQKVKISLENGYWGRSFDDEMAVIDNAVLTAGDADDLATVSSTAAIDISSANTVNTTVHAIGSDYVEFSFADDTGLNKGGTFVLYLNVASDAAGEVKVNIESIDSRITSGTYVIGIAGDSSTVAKVVGEPTLTGRTDVVKGATIEIREVAVNSVEGRQSVKLTLPKGVEWVDVKGSNDMVKSGTYTTGYAVDASGNNITRDIIVSFDAAENEAVREGLTLVPYIKVGKEAKLGEIAVQVRENQAITSNDIENASGLVIAKYVEEGVTVSTVAAEDLPEVWVGREADEIGDNFIVTVTLTELQDNSLIADKYVDFKFDESVRLTSDVAVKLAKDNGDKNPLLTVTGNKVENEFEWMVPTDGDAKANKYTFYIPVTLEADVPAGDIEITVSGAKAGIDETTLVVAKAVTPITAEFNLSSVKTGVQNQAIGDIVIKETRVGALREGDLTITLDNNNQNFTFDVANAEVVAGDLELVEDTDDNCADDGVITINVDRTSIKEAAEIKISNVEVTMDRTPAEGKYEVAISGTAAVDVLAYKEFNNAVITGDFINVVTPADQGVTATFKIGESKYTVNGVEYTMDAPSYVDANNRTMVSIRYVANALGVSDNAIIWNQDAQTATIFGKSTVVVKIGENSMTVNGSVVPMDTQAVSKDGRIYVPLRYIANALGAAVEWDQAAQTAKFFTVAQ